jgi:hypothetical protein
MGREMQLKAGPGATANVMTLQQLADDGHVWARLDWCSRAGIDAGQS